MTGPQAGATISSVADIAAGEPGIQLDVSAQTNLIAGDAATLTVTAGDSVAVYNAEVASGGEVTFSSVTMPAGEVSLTVSAESGEGCGSGSDTVSVIVSTDTPCTLAVDEGPIPSPYFDPLPVLNTTNDSDPALPNFQSNLTITTMPGFHV
ncbi:MAG TPA: hypothetical protein VFG83_10940, partial [Kofleriaceae bacterium]|nr:hypothetical protein [Kofleriaceae bacterium]